MPKYYFDFRENDDLMFDDVGVELADHEAAHREGFRGLTAIASETVFALASNRHLTMEVRNEHGVLFKLSAAFQSNILRDEF